MTSKATPLDRWPKQKSKNKMASLQHIETSNSVDAHPMVDPGKIYPDEQSLAAGGENQPSELTDGSNGEPADDKAAARTFAAPTRVRRSTRP